MDETLRRLQRELERSGRQVIVVDRRDTHACWVMKRDDGSLAPATIARDEIACRHLWWSVYRGKPEAAKPVKVKLWEVSNENDGPRIDEGTPAL